jgi:hypothetical protein
MNWQTTGFLRLQSIKGAYKGATIFMPGAEFFVTGVHPLISTVSVRKVG